MLQKTNRGGSAKAFKVSGSGEWKWGWKWGNLQLKPSQVQPIAIRWHKSGTNGLFYAKEKFLHS
tara:strand:+ start:1409 stop:1600 length:192 start_codon:yes stop_codon:yes gene_type:complete